MEGEFKDKDQWYNNCKDFWGKSDTSVQGVMIGNDHVQEADIKASCELIEGLIKSKKLNPDKVIDCGAGIGRVTNNVLVKYFTECDLLEQDEKFIHFCKDFFSNEPKVKNYFQNSIQNFEFNRKYDVIWIQWCLENLDDNDVINFLTKCKNNLEGTGLIIIKENIVSKGTEISNYDFSRVRSDKLFKDIFERSNLKIFKHFHNPNWPKDMMKVSVFVLKLH